MRVLHERCCGLDIHKRGLLTGDWARRGRPQGGAHLQHHDRRFARPVRLAAGSELRTGGHGVDRVLLAPSV